MPKIELKSGSVTKHIEEYNRKAKEEDIIEITGNQSKPESLYGYYHRQGTKIEFSGSGSRDKQGNPINGRVGIHFGELLLHDAKLAARGACLDFLNKIATACEGDLNGVSGLVMTVYVNCDKEFTQLTQVADGASELLINVFGKYVGKPIRTTVGTASLPNNMLVEVTGTVYITKDLAVALDLRDAKNLAVILKWIKQYANNPMNKFLNTLLDAGQLTKNDKFGLHESAEECVAILEYLDRDRLNEAISTSQEPLFETVKSKQDLIDLIRHRAQLLNLTKQQNNKYTDVPAVHQNGNNQTFQFKVPMPIKRRASSADSLALIDNSAKKIKQ